MPCFLILDELRADSPCVGDPDGFSNLEQMEAVLQRARLTVAAVAAVLQY